MSSPNVVWEFIKVSLPMGTIDARQQRDALDVIEALVVEEDPVRLENARNYYKSAKTHDDGISDSEDEDDEVTKTHIVIISKSFIP